VLHRFGATPPVITTRLMIVKALRENTTGKFNIGLGYFGSHFEKLVATIFGSTKSQARMANESQ
jgi:hypothetical protein